jgi:type II secretory pathway pseudopilin PulG
MMFPRKLTRDSTASRQKQHASRPTSHHSLITNHSGHEAGFTLIEIALVLFFFGVILAYVLPKVDRSHDVTASARQLIGAIRSLMLTASSTKQTHTLYLDLNRQTYWAMRLDGESERPPADSALSGQVTLPEHVQFLNVTTSRQGALTSGVASIRFLPVGRTERAVIRLGAQQAATLTLLLNPLTGAVRILDGYADPPPAEPIPERVRAIVLPVQPAGQ